MEHAEKKTSREDKKNQKSVLYSTSQNEIHVMNFIPEPSQSDLIP